MKLMIPLLLLTSLAQAATLKVAVVDSGLDVTDPRFSKHLCPTGNKDFTGEGLTDINGHGTAMTGLIEKYAKDGDYCLVIYKYYSEAVPTSVNLAREVEALEYAGNNGVEIVNLSSDGPGFNEKEYLAIKTNPDVTFVVAAGNDGLNMDLPGDQTYPACYSLKNEKVIGNVDENGKRVSSSNYGKAVTAVEMGDHVIAPAIHGYGVITGTSVSTAIYTGKLIRDILNAK